jgi:hypothetical protein
MAIISIKDLKELLDKLEEQGPDGKTGLWDIAVSINRTNPVPLDYSTIIVLDSNNKNSTFEGEAQKYAENNPVAYPGQHITVAAPQETRSFILQPEGYTYPYYTIENGTLETKYNSSANIAELAYKTNVDYQVNALTLEKVITVEPLPDDSNELVIFLDRSLALGAAGKAINLDTSKAIAVIASEQKVSIDRNSFYTDEIPPALVDASAAIEIDSNKLVINTNGFFTKTNPPKNVKTQAKDLIESTDFGVKLKLN